MGPDANMVLAVMAPYRFGTTPLTIWTRTKLPEWLAPVGAGPG